MSRYYSYLNSAKQILQQYSGEEPFSSFVKNYFSQQKKYGSTDRKQISHLCYCFFRLGKSLLQVSAEERILIGFFLCSNGPNEILQQLKPEWNEKIDLSVEQKLLIINPPASRADSSLLIGDVFPWKEELSDGIDHRKFCESFFTQPDLFLRLRPGYENIVKEKLFAAEINFIEINSSCLALPNTSKIENIIELDKEAVVQDYSSQRVAKFLPVRRGPSDTVWDCCAGSGGKSLLLYDINPDINLTVSDVRESILINLKKRFAKAGIKKYNSFIADLTKPNLKPHPASGVTNFELILCDAPCTGSGTWSRTSEQLYFFNEKKIKQYASLQKKIVSNVIPQLQENAFLAYITCSVFKKENEEVVDYIKKQFSFELIKMELLKGYDKKADTIFVALMKKTL